MKKIVMVSRHSCIRVHKMALPLIESGLYEVHLLANKSRSYSDAYSTFGHWLEVGQLSNFIKLHAPTTDIFHVHNEPSWPVTLIKEHCDVPVVLDVHDSFAARVTQEEQDEAEEKGNILTRITAEERNNFQLADALVFPGESFGELVENEFALSQPNIVLRSHMPRRMFRYNAQDWQGGLVYEGMVKINTEDGLSYGYRYCNYLELAEKAKELGIDFHIYGGRDDKKFLEAYGDIALVHEPLDFDSLVRDISRHDWGLVGNIMPTSEWDVAMPNKLFEYIAAGVPIVAMNAKECEEYVIKHKIGIAVKSLEELTERWSEHTEIRKNLLKTRVSFSMEKNNQCLKELYDGLLG